MQKGPRAGAVLWCQPLQTGREKLFERRWQKMLSIGVRVQHVSPMYAETCGSLLAMIVCLRNRYCTNNVTTVDLANLDYFSLEYLREAVQDASKQFPKGIVC